jgi:hypothetical protein
MMKECKKHAEQLCMIPGRVDTVARKEDFNRGWREALEWVKKKLNCEIQPGDIEYFIDKELGDT